MRRPGFLSPAWHAKLFLFISVTLMGVYATPAQTEQNSDGGYALSVADEIRIRVIEWNASSSAFEEWTALSGSYLVGPNGMFAFPFVGAVAAEGRSTVAVEDALGNGLRDVLGLVTTPDVTVEVIGFGPIYVTGDVANPGQFAFTPGMTVIKAMSLAGGSKNGEADGRLEREAISTQGALDVLESNHGRLVARQARVAAELAGETVIAVPDSLAIDGQGALITIEQAIMDANVLRHSMSLEALESQKALLTRELEALTQKRKSTLQQLASAQEQLDAMTELADRGLAINSRVASLESMVADIDGRLLDIDTAMLRARQDLGGIEQRAVEISSTRNSNLAGEMQQVERELAELALRISTQQALVRDVVAQGASPVGREPHYSFTVVRGSEQLEADETTAIRPGDVVVARIDL